MIKDPMLNDILIKMQEILNAGRKGALATVVKSVGSTPRHEGTKMLVDESGAITGTIGGGIPEKRVIETAIRVIDTGSAEYMTIRLNERDGPEMMLCGGEMHVFVEAVMQNVIYIFGGGHVGFALGQLCSIMGLLYVICGSDEKLVNKERFPSARELHMGPLDEILEELILPPTAGVVIATRNAVEDEKVLEWALAQKCMYLGMLGSDTKRRKLIERAKKRGLPSSGSSHLHCPAGLEIAAETPQEIAVSIMAEIISILRGI